jgi:hypothetical protein
MPRGGDRLRRGDSGDLRAARAMQTPDDLLRVIDERDRDVPTGVDSLNADSDVSRDARYLGDRYGHAYGLPRGNLDGSRERETIRPGVEVG